MLFTYPIAPPAENWLHECMVAAVRVVHQRVDAGKGMPKWPQILPAPFQTKLASRRGLAQRFKNYAGSIKALTPAERATVLDALEAQNSIPQLLARQSDCARLGDLPVAIHEPATELFTFAFGLLTPFDARQRQYEAVCNFIPARICPFCGCEGLDAPGAPQEDFDHYLPRSKYPFAAANLRNLAPMGGRCNSAYKKMQDPLRRLTGERRLARDPFSGDGVAVSFDNSVVDQINAGPVVSDWIIDFLPAGEDVETWAELFHVRERWKRDVLDVPTFNQWLSDFQNFCLASQLPFATDADVLSAVQRYEQYISGSGLNDRAFLKAAVFRFLHRRCQLQCPRLLPILRDLAGAPQP